MIRELDPGKVALDFGPTQMIIQVFGNGASSSVAIEAAVYASKLVGELAEFKLLAARPQQEILTVDGLPDVLQRMIEAVKISGDTDLTPMAAVAGTLSDMTADWLFARGVAKVIVNNGGDIAIRLSGAERAVIGKEVQRITGLASWSDINAKWQVVPRDSAHNKSHETVSDDEPFPIKDPFATI